MRTSFLIALCAIQAAVAQKACLPRNPADPHTTNMFTIWCNQNCNHILPFCPPEVCRCAPGCVVNPLLDRASNLPQCIDNCLLNPTVPSSCRTDICTCAPMPAPNPFVAAFFLEGGQEVPATASTNSGSCFSWFAPASRANLVVRCAHTVSDFTVAHVHQAAAGRNGPVVFSFTPTPTPPAFSPLNIFTPATPATLQTWLRGEYYVNIHNPTNPGGNIRGQISRFGSNTRYFNFFLTADEAAPNGRAGASGACGAAMRRTPGSTTTFDLIIACLHNIPASAVTRAVVGGGAIGSTGVNILDFPLASTPFIEGRFTINAAQSTNTMNGLWFVRIDTDAGTSIRGQIRDSTSIVYPQ